MRFARFLIPALTVVVVLVLLAGCGGKGGGY
jgi:predicted small lipoprotein YifL